MPNVEILQGDCIESLKKLPDGCIQTCVTSPPYFGLRDYGVEEQIGLEETPNGYIQKLVDVFAEVYRVLSDNGTLWCNIGDSYAGSWGAQGRQGETGTMHGRSVTSARQIESHPKNKSRTGSLKQEGIKQKELIGIPWRLAFALQDFGWYLRQDIIWSKPNPMPESVRDRCTKSHEYIFLLSKKPTYYFDQEAISEPLAESSISRLQQDIDKQEGSSRVPGKTNGNMKAACRKSGNKERKARPGTPKNNSQNLKGSVPWEGATRNKRSVWSVSTKPYKGAHFAVFPVDLIEPCILAGSKKGDTVLDPFNGSGTTGECAISHGRNYIGLELNQEYIDLTHKRLSLTQYNLFS